MNKNAGIPKIIPKYIHTPFHMLFSRFSYHSSISKGYSDISQPSKPLPMDDRTYPKVPGDQQLPPASLG